MSGKWLRKLIATYSLLGILAGCGGGGSSSTSPSGALTLSPSTISVTAIEGSSASLSTTLTLNASVVTGDAYVFYQDTNDVLDSNATLTATSSTTATLTFNTLTSLSVGRHTGTLDIYVCKDSDCNTPYDTNPAKLHYTITVNPAPPAAIITPTSIAVTTEMGDITRISLTAQINPGFSIYDFGISDSNGLFSSTLNSTATSSTSYTLTATIPAISQPGTYSGVAYIYLCSGYSCNSSNDVPGSPIAVPYTITVTPMVLLAPVITTTGLPEWGTYQGNAGHTGNVPVTLDASRFLARWNWTNPAASVGNGINTLTAVTTGSGKVVVASTGFATQSNPTYLYALDETSGVLDWQYSFGTLSRVNHPAVADGRIFVASSGHSDTFMWSFDLNNGVLQYKTAFTSQWDQYLAPVVKGGYVYTNGGYFGGMYRFKERTGNLSWFASLEQFDWWSPAVDDNYAYAYTGGNLHAISLSTGVNAYTLQNSSGSSGSGITPVLPGDGTALIVDGKSSAYSIFSFHLIRYNLSTQAELWRAEGSFANDPVVGGNVVYALNTKTNALEAYGLSTGALLWSWSPSDANEKAAGNNLVVTNNLIFVSTTAATYAIDLSTHQTVWSDTHTGRLALSSNKVLYITSDTEIHAFSLE